MPTECYANAAGASSLKLSAEERAWPRYGNQLLAEGKGTKAEKPSYNSFQKDFGLQHEKVLRSGNALVEVVRRKAEDASG